jgi:hypothetical protein
MVTVLIIDNDLGFMFWLGQILNEAGYAVLPAKSASEAVELMSENNIEADLLIINPSLPGVVRLVGELRPLQRWKVKPTTCPESILLFPSRSAPMKRNGRRGCRQSANFYRWILQRNDARSGLRAPRGRRGSAKQDRRAVVDIDIDSVADLGAELMQISRFRS